MQNSGLRLSDTVCTAPLGPKSGHQEAARNPTVSPRSVLANLTNELMEESPTSVNHLSKSKTFTKKIQRARNKMLVCPEITKTWD